MKPFVPSVRSTIWISLACAALAGCGDGNGGPDAGDVDAGDVDGGMGFDAGGGDGGSAATCGDGLVEGDEVCDDGTTTPCGECNADCSGVGTAPVCGDSILCGDTERCDDGNGISNDGCSAVTCEVELGYVCVNDPLPSVCRMTCGNSMLDTGEMCDDGGNVSLDGCTADCQREDGWFCSGTPSSCAEICGDGRVVGDETCDDANILACGGCSTTCNGAGTGPCDDGTGCTADSDCSSGVCDASGQCVACTNDAACTGSPNGSECTGGDCRPCDPVDGSGCPSGTCQAGTFTCAGCATDGDCGGGQCVANVCRACDPLGNAGCSEPAPVCAPGTFVCVDCASDSDCGGGQCVSNVCRGCDPSDDAGCSEPSPVCAPGTFVCVDCVGDTDCGGTTTQCVSSVCRGCDPVDDAPCSIAAPICAPATFACVECIGDTDCAGTERRSSGVCVPRTTGGTIFYRGDFATDGLDEIGRYGVVTGTPTRIPLTRVDLTAAASSSIGVSPDGTRIAFTADIELAGRFDLYIMNRDGTGMTRLVTSPDFGDIADVTFSPSGTRIAFSGDLTEDQLRDIHVISVSGGAYPMVSPARPLSDPALQPGTFAWSRDSRYLAITGDLEAQNAIQLYITDVTVAVPTPVPAFSVADVGIGIGSRGVQMGLIDWTVDNRVVMKALMGVDTTRGLFWVNANGTGFGRVPGTTGDLGSLGVSADGTRLAYATSNGVGGHEIFVMPANASASPVQITDGTIPAGRNPQFIELLRWSPNGAFIAFNADFATDNTFEPYVISSSGGAFRRLVAIGAGVSQDSEQINWSPDSTRIAFIADHRADQDRELFVTNDVTSTDQAPVLVQSVVFGGDVHFLFFRP